MWSPFSWGRTSAVSFLTFGGTNSAGLDSKALENEKDLKNGI